MANKKGLAGRLLASAAAGAVALIGLAGAANAVPGDPNDPDAPWSEGNAERKGSLTIHKLLGDNSNQSNNGTVQDVDRAPVAGVQFTVCQVLTDGAGNLVDLSGNQGTDNDAVAGWDYVAELDGKVQNDDFVPVAPQLSTTCFTERTDKTGEVKFEDLPMGLYYVTETDHPENIISDVHPFLVTIPYPSKSTVDGKEKTTWLWDVNVYPKNQSEETELYKEIQAPASGWSLGSINEWTVTSSTMSSLKEQNRGKNLTNYLMVDPLDPALQYQVGSMKVQAVKDAKCGDDNPYANEAAEYCPVVVGNSFEPGVDYIVYVVRGTTPENDNVYVEMTKAGIDKMNKLDLDARLEFSFETELVSFPSNGANGGGALYNTAYEYPDYGLVTDPTDPEKPTTPPTEPPTEPPTDPTDPEKPVTPPTPPVTPPGPPTPPTEPPGETNTVGYYWGKIEITKVNKDDLTEMLPGAEFQALKGSCDEYTKLPGAEDDAWVKAKDEDGKLGIWTGVSTDTGKIELEGLYVGKINTHIGNGGDRYYTAGEDGDTYETFEAAYNSLNTPYCLVETKAPDGYVLPAWSANGTTVKVFPGDGSGIHNQEVNHPEIKNGKAEGPQLPLTGAAGTALLVIGGLTLVGLAGAGVVAQRRRAAEQA